MKKTTKLLTAVASFAIALLLLASIRPQQVYAEQNTKDNGSVIYKEMKSADELRDYIDGDGAYSSQDTIETDWKGYTDVHKIVLDKDGTLVVCTLDKDRYSDFQLFTNASLTAALKEAGSSTTDRIVYATYDLKKGTYYYRSSRWNGNKPLTVTTYLGFIPKDGKINQNSGKLSTTVHDENIVDFNLINSPSELDEFISNDVAYTSQDTIETKWEGEGKVYKFSVEEEGWLFIKSICNDSGIDMHVYSNVDLTSRIAIGGIPTTFDKEPLAVYLTPGTYYYKGNRWNGYEVANFSTYLGFMPSSTRVDVEDIKLSKDKSYATVTFSYDHDYLSDFLNSTIRVKKGKVAPEDINNDKVWETDTRANALESETLKVNANGIYTARISGKKDNFYCMVTFNVKGIVSAPKTPKITSAKKNATVIKGTAAANNTVIVKVNNKTYKTKTGNDGKWSVKLSKKVASKTVITVYTTNSNGAKSQTTKFTVK